MQSTKHSRPTVGVLAGAQVYYGTILGNFIGPVLQGAHCAAQNRGCNLLLACGMEHSTISGRPAWPLLTHEADFVLVTTYVLYVKGECNGKPKKVETLPNC